MPPTLLLRRRSRVSRLAGTPRRLALALLGTTVLGSGLAAESEWHSGPLEPALERARAESRRLLLYFWMDGSQHCARLWGETLSAERAGEALEELVCFGAKVTDPNGAELVQRFGVTTLPTMLFLTPAGEVDDVILGFIPLTDLLDELARIAADSGTVSDLRARSAAAPDDLDLRLLLAQKLGHVGLTDESEEVLESIRRADPEGLTVVGAQLAFYEARDGVIAGARDPDDPGTYDLRPLERHVARIVPPPVRFEGWNWLARTEEARGRGREARAAYRAAWEDVPENQRLVWGAEVVGRFAARRAAEGDRVALVVFGESAFTLCPLTSDAALLEAALSRVEPGWRAAPGADSRDRRSAPARGAGLCPMARRRPEGGRGDRTPRPAARPGLGPARGAPRALRGPLTAGGPPRAARKSFPDPERD